MPSIHINSYLNWNKVMKQCIVCMCARYCMNSQVQCTYWMCSLFSCLPFEKFRLENRDKTTEKHLKYECICQYSWKILKHRIENQNIYKSQIRNKRSNYYLLFLGLILTHFPLSLSVSVRHILQMMLFIKQLCTVDFDVIVAHGSTHLKRMKCNVETNVAGTNER